MTHLKINPGWIAQNGNEDTERICKIKLQLLRRLYDCGFQLVRHFKATRVSQNNGINIRIYHLGGLAGLLKWHIF